MNAKLKSKIEHVVGGKKMRIISVKRVRGKSNVLYIASEVNE